MQVNITVRHVEIDNNLKPYMNEKLEKLKKYNNAIEEARAILDKEKFNFTSEITLSGRGFRVVAFEKDQDMKACFDLCLTNAQNQLKKIREKEKSKKLRGFFSSLKVFKRDKKQLISPKGSIVRVESFAVKPMSPEEAALELEAFNKEFIVFRNSSDNNVNVLYKRKNKDYGLIEP